MIKSFGSKSAKQVWDGVYASKLPADVQRIARRKLRMINNAQSVSDLRVPPANRLKKLKGPMAGLYAIRVNRQWRITFRWTDQNAEQVKIEDYHV